MQIITNVFNEKSGSTLISEDELEALANQEPEKTAAALFPPRNEQVVGQKPRRWIDIRGWSDDLIPILKSRFPMVSGDILTSVGMSQSSKVELEPDDLDGHGYVGHFVLHVATMKNCPFTYTGKQAKLASKRGPNGLDNKPPDLDFEQLEMFLIWDPADDGGNTLITVMKDENSQPSVPGIARSTTSLNSSTTSFGSGGKGGSGDRRTSTPQLAAKKGRKLSKGMKQDARGKKAKRDNVPRGQNIASILERQCNMLERSYSSTSLQNVVLQILDRVIDQTDYTRSILLEWTEKLDDEITRSPKADHVQHLHELEHVLGRFDQQMAPLVEDMKQFDDGESALSDYFHGQLSGFRRSRDEVMFIFNEIDRLDDRRESLVHVYREQKQENASKVLMVLTLVTTLFIPAQFLTGLWGMNFDAMPELNYKYGYLMFWLLLLAMTGTSLAVMQYLGFLKRV